MEKNSVVDLINKELKIYGSNQYGDPLFRCVFSEYQLETRKGVFEEFAGKIFVRTYIGTKTVPKYPMIKRRWIIERWAPGHLAYHPDLETDKDGVYICIYVFQDANKNYLPPLLKVAKILIEGGETESYKIYGVLNPRKKSEILATDEQLEEKDKELEIAHNLKEIQIESDEFRTKDPKSLKETMSSGRTTYRKGTKL